MDNTSSHYLEKMNTVSLKYLFEEWKMSQSQRKVSAIETLLSFPSKELQHGQFGPIAILNQSQRALTIIFFLFKINQSHQFIIL